MKDLEEVRAAQAAARRDHRAGNLGKPAATLVCAAKKGSKQCGRSVGAVYKIHDVGLFLADAVFRPGTRPYVVKTEDYEAPLYSPDELQVSRLLDPRLADGEEGTVTVSCSEHYNIPVRLDMLRDAINSGQARVPLDPQAHNATGRR